MDLEDVETSLLVGCREFDFSVNTTWSCQGWIQGIRSISGHEDLDVTSGIETIKLVDDFKHGSLDLGITFSESCSTNGIDLIKEDDT